MGRSSWRGALPAGSGVNPVSYTHLLFQQEELIEEIPLDALAGLVSRPQSIAERFDHMIGCDGNVCGAFADHAQQRCEHASDSRDLAAVAIPC